MANNFPGRTNSGSDLNYHTVPILVVFSLRESVNRRQRAEQPEGYRRNIDVSDHGRFNWAKFVRRFYWAYVEAARVVRVLPSLRRRIT